MFLKYLLMHNQNLIILDEDPSVLLNGIKPRLVILLVLDEISM